MITDPQTLYEMNQIRINEFLGQAQKNRLAKEAAVSYSSILSSLSAKISSAIQNMLPGAQTEASYMITGEHKRVTAEIPSL
jgi:hypothetical protein